MPDYPLIGYPIAKSLAPLFQNKCFELENSPSRYFRWSTSRITPKVLDWVRSEACGGAAVTMPNKATIIPYLDEITPESKLTGAVNTIVKVRTDSGIRLVGTNTDYLGITVALRTAILSTQAGREYPSSTAHSFPRGQLSGAVIGGGATTRSAILSLHRLGLGPIFLINRDEAEVAATTAWFQRTELVREQGLELIHVKDPGEVERYLVDEGSRAPLGIVVGAIPAILPQSSAERLVYATATYLFTSSSSSLAHLHDVSSNKPDSEHLPIPSQPIFLDMAYYPRPTPLTQIAGALGWQTVDGIQAMIEQGFAQQRMWRMGNASVEVGMQRGILGEKAEDEARKVLLDVGQVVVEGVEVDRADEE